MAMNYKQDAVKQAGATLKLQNISYFSHFQYLQP